MKKVNIRSSVTTIPKEGLVIKNGGNSQKHTIFGIPFSAKNQTIHFRLNCNNRKVRYRLLDVKGGVLYTAQPNRDYFLSNTRKFYFIDIVSPPRATVSLSDLVVERSGAKESAVEEHLSGDTLIITSEYPETGFNTSFIYDIKTLAQDGKHRVNVAAVSDQRAESAELLHDNNIPVAIMGYNELRLLLQVKKFDRIVIYNFSEKVAQVLDGSDMTHSRLYIIVDGEEVLFSDFATYGTPYFKQSIPAPDHLLESFAEKKRIINKYTESKNTLWIFPDTSIRKKAENLLSVTFKRYVDELPTVDKDVFCTPKQIISSPVSIGIVSNMSNNSKFGVDVVTRAILELSTKPWFKKTPISIYGHGDLFHKLTSPLGSFENVTIHKAVNDDFQRADIYKNHSIVIAPRKDPGRQTTISLLEALSTGTVVVAPASAATSFDKHDRLCTFSTNDFRDLAVCISNIRKKLPTGSGSAKTPRTLMNIIEGDSETSLETYTPTTGDRKPLLTIVVPSYNCEKFLRNSILSLVNHPFAHKLEVIIVNDGSKDSTASVARQIIKEMGGEKKSIIKLIDKENGGHGSTINAGIKAARGKYFRLMDGDDYFYTDNFVSFLQKLEEETSDIVLTDYIEDFAITATKNTPVLYEFMTPGVQYDVEFMNYDGYGFWRWGPLLPTNTYKTSLLQEADFLIDEHCFYVDMEYNLITYIQAKTATYYPLPIYNYYLGRPGQSMSKESMKRNVLHHEKVSLRLISELYARSKDISPNKRSYLINRLIIPMCKTQYFITTEYFNDGKHFRSFDTKLKKYPEFYNHPDIAGKVIRTHRLSGGFSVKADRLLKQAGKLLNG